ncbi:MAG: hypothetical protein GVY16_11920 [Planctomycetes bacterium]|jgi:hypothetical protein|nr:hypothetical protein [Phycisphaerae bacterium]NBB96429.1 hypothetical protein [Planctomycetota bacterium]
MDATEQQYERIARYLDGETVDLTDGERALAAEIRQGFTALADHLPAAPPVESTDRARRRLVAAVAGRLRLRSIGRVMAVAGMAAAAVLVLIGAQRLWMPDAPGPIAPSYVPTAVMRDAIENEPDTFDVELALIAEDVLQQQAEFADVAQASKPTVLDGGLQDLQEELDTFWLDEQQTDSVEQPASFEALLIESGQG